MLFCRTRKPSLSIGLTLRFASNGNRDKNRRVHGFPDLPTRESYRMNVLRNLIVGCAAVALFALTAAPADAGCLGKSKGCCEPCCQPVCQPACCEPAPAPVCCEPAPVCCPPPPVRVSWCVVDPCDPCATYNVSACVPACCANTQPCMVGCKKGMFGRKILTYKFPCCGHCVEVVITCFGRTIVR